MRNNIDRQCIIKLRYFEKKKEIANMNLFDVLSVRPRDIQFLYIVKYTTDKIN